MHPVDCSRGRLSGPPALIAAGAVFWLLGATVFFRDPWMSGFDLVMGDLGDSRLITFLHEHLYDWLRGRAELRSPAAFFPQQGTLGFSDAFLLDALPYALFRTLGADRYLAMLLLQVALSLLGFGCAAVVYIRYLRIRPLFAYPAAALLTFPNNLFFKASVGHVNFLGLYYVPAIVLLALWAFEGFPNLTRRSLLRGFAAGLLFAALFSTAYYVAWMFALTLLIAAACAAAHRAISRVGAIDKAAIGPLASLLGAAAAGFAVGLIPFAYIYAPVLATAPPRGLATYLALAPTPLDMLNVSGANLMWGWLVDALFGTPGNNDVERSLAVTPVLTLIFVWAAAKLLRRDAAGLPDPAWQRHFLIACLGVFALGWLLTLKIGQGSLFWLPFNYIPGGVAIRAGGRLQLVVNLWVVTGLAVAFDRWSRMAWAAERRRVLLGCGLLAVCAMEQLNRHPSGLSRSGERMLVASVPPPPAACRSFFLDRPADPVQFQFHAMALAPALALPTLNGSSGLVPPGWQLDPYDADYLPAVRRWIDAHRPSGVCGYDQTAGRWSAIVPLVVAD